MPALINAKKLNTVVWSLGAGIILYGLLRLIFRKRIAAVLQPIVKNVNLDLVDEISYRSVLIGFPIFTLRCINFCDDLGSNCMDTILGMGSKRSMGINNLVVLCSLFTLAIIKGMARGKISLACCYWFCYHYV